MSGIAGVFYRDGRPASDETVARMSAAIARRGADAHGISCEGSVGMAHRMMWSTPESLHERQPLVSGATSVRLVADARIDNRDELITALRVPARQDASDAELVAAAYARWGSGCVEHLLGDFAFALWDAARHEFFCARDPMGVKPFYYFKSASLFAFGSQARALFALPEVSREIDAEQISAFIEGLPADRTQTHYTAIRRLPAAHAMTVGAMRSVQHRYWGPDPGRLLRLSSSREYADAFLEIFTDAVRARMRSVHPIGAALSGGLDSSSITCVARRLRRETAASPLNTFSLAFPSLPERDLRLIDERRYVETVIRDGGVVQTWVRGDQVSPVGDIDDILEHLDEPFAAPNLYLHWAMYRAAAARGARVFLDGFDGDTTVSHGFGRFNGLVDRGEWDTFEREIRALAERRGVRAESLLVHFGLPHLSELARRGQWAMWARLARQLARRFDLPRGATLLDRGLRPGMPPALRSAYRAMRGVQSMNDSLLHADIRRALRAHAGRDTSDGDATLTESESHARGLAQPAYQLTLELADQAAAAFGVEPRYPFFDRRLIDFCLSVPDNEKLADGWPRLVFRRAMKGILPEEIRSRIDKGNLSPNFHRSLRASQASAPPTAAGSPLGTYVDLEALGNMRRDYCAEKSTLGRSADGHTLFRVLVLERWLATKVPASPEIEVRAAPAAALAVA